MSTLFPRLAIPQNKHGNPSAMRPRLLLLLVIFSYSLLSAHAGNFMPLRLVVGNSMEPVLYAGDIVFLRDTPFQNLTQGDVVAYQIPDTTSTNGRPITILHRVQRIKAMNGERVLLTKGDNSAIDPWPVTSSLVRGKLDLRIAGVGKPVLMLANAGGILLVSFASSVSLLYVLGLVAMRHASSRNHANATHTLATPNSVTPFMRE